MFSNVFQLKREFPISPFWFEKTEIDQSDRNAEKLEPMVQQTVLAAELAETGARQLA